MRTRLGRASARASGSGRLIGAGLALLLGLTLIGLRSLDAPLVLYPSSGSLPAGFYVRTFQPAVTGEIIALEAPEKARLHLEGDTPDQRTDFLLIKPLAAGPGDHVCNDGSGGLRINGHRIAPTESRDSHGRELPIWEGCRMLSSEEAFVVSTFVKNSFDSRYFGPIDFASIKGVYRQAF